jgi:hypothetical protein
MRLKPHLIFIVALFISFGAVAQQNSSTSLIFSTDHFLIGDCISLGISKPLFNSKNPIEIGVTYFINNSKQDSLSYSFRQRGYARNTYQRFGVKASFSRKIWEAKKFIRLEFSSKNYVNYLDLRGNVTFVDSASTYTGPLHQKNYIMFHNHIGASIVFKVSEHLSLIAYQGVGLISIYKHRVRAYERTLDFHLGLANTFSLAYNF